MGEYSPVCIRFIELKINGNELIGRYQQGFIPGDLYGITRLDGDFESFHDYEVVLDPMTGKEKSRPKELK